MIRIRKILNALILFVTFTVALFAFSTSLTSIAFAAIEQMPEESGYSGLHIYDINDTVPSGVAPISSNFEIIESGRYTTNLHEPWAGDVLPYDYTSFEITGPDTHLKIRWNHIGYYIDEYGQRIEIGVTLDISECQIGWIGNTWWTDSNDTTGGYQSAVLISPTFYDSSEWMGHQWLLGVTQAHLVFHFFPMDHPDDILNIDFAYMSATSLDADGGGQEFVVPREGHTGVSYVPDLENTALIEGTILGLTPAYYNKSVDLVDENNGKVILSYSGDSIGIIYGDTQGCIGFEWEFSSTKDVSVTCSPTIHKTVDGGSPPAGHIFDFSLTGITNPSIKKTLQTDANGNLNIGQLENYSERGEFIYKIVETTHAGYASKQPIFLKVKVTSNQGILNTSYAFYSDSNCTNILTNIDNHKLTKGISITKTANPSKIVVDAAVPGSTISYSFTITNTGEADLSNVSIDDELNGISSITYNWTDGEGIIKAGKSITATATYTINQQDIDTGLVTNTAIAYGFTVLNEKATSNKASVTTNIEQNPSINLEKTANTDLIEDAHADKTKVIYSFTITNTGNVTLHNITLTDPMLGGSLTPNTTTLAPNATATASATYVVNQSDIENGNILNEAETHGLSPNNSDASDVDECNVKVIQKPSVSFTKNVNKSTIENAHANDELVYTFTVKNTGNTILSNLVMNDAMLGGNKTDVLNKTTLYPGESSVGTITYRISQSDIDHGSVVNTADISIFSDSNDQTLTAKDDANTNIVREANISFEKTADRDHIGNAAKGDMITYSFIVTNTGNTTVTGGRISDPLLGNISLNKTTLLPGESATASKQYNLTQADIDAGVRDNTATTIWNAYDGSELSKESSWHIDIDRSPNIMLNKDIIGDTVIRNASAGDTVQYELTITNTGNTTLTDITLTDELDGVTIDNSKMKTVLAPGEATNAIATYSLKQSDIDLGDVLNIAKASGKSPDGCTPDYVYSSDNEDLDIVRTPSIFLDKTAQPVKIEDALPGDQVTYTFTIENNGNTTLEDILLNDPMLGGNIELDNHTLLPGESTQVKVQYSLTQADIDNGYVHNEATVTSTAPEGCDNANPSATDEADVDLIQSPELVIHKNIVLHDGKNQDELTTGDEVFFSIIIGNAGNTTLTDVQLIDDMLGGNISLDDAVKGIDMSLIGLTEQTETTDGDNDDNGMENIELEENMSPNIVGNESVENISHVYDKEHSIDDTLPITTLQPGEYLYIELPYTITQEDMNNGRIDNIAETTALPPMKQDGTQEQLEASDEAILDLPSHPSIELIKEADTEKIIDAIEGDTIKYALTIKNTGDVSLNQISLSDELDGVVIDDDELENMTLEPGEETVIMASYDVSSSDIENGKVDNHAFVVAHGISDCIANGYDQTVTDDDIASVALYAPVETPEQASDVFDILLAQTGDEPIRIALPLMILVMVLSAIIANVIYRRSK